MRREEKTRQSCWYDQWCDKIKLLWLSKLHKYCLMIIFKYLSPHTGKSTTRSWRKIENRRSSLSRSYRRKIRQNHCRGKSRGDIVGERKVKIFDWVNRSHPPTGFNFLYYFFGFFVMSEFISCSRIFSPFFLFILCISFLFRCNYHDTNIDFTWIHLYLTII